MPARVRDYAIASASFGIAINSLIGKRLALPDPNIPGLPSDDPENAAMQVRAEWGLGQRPIKNVIHLLEAKGTRVFSLAESHASVDAFSFWHDGHPYVFLNAMSSNAKNGQRGRFDAAHELGHLVMHLSRPGDISSRISEHEADSFASAFLMPSSAVKAAAGNSRRGFGVDEIVLLKQRWGVSAMAMARRLRDVGVLSQDRYHNILVQMSQRGWRRGEPDPAARESSQIWPKVLSLLAEDHVSAYTIASRLGVLPGDLSEVLFGQVLAVAPSSDVPGDKIRRPKAKGQLYLVSADQES